MTSEEVDAFLAAERTCRVATTAGDGRPHVAPLWFVWDGEYLWLNSIVKSKRWSDLQRDPRIAVVIDGGEQFHELHGVEISGIAEVVGEVPRTSTPDDVVANAELLFARKYMGGDHFIADGRHAWLRIKADEVVSWDFRKNAAPQQWSR
ncbi:pyridoxamine 5'-phosphate oxidase family protein [Prescottella defluvii]|nr:pyridoxamine 5'-phosphate oxidase family protein [Prescottella defluvii]